MNVVSTLKNIDESTLTNRRWIKVDITLTDVATLFQHISTLNQRSVFAGNTLTLKEIFYKTEIIFKKLECRFLVESTKIENASLSYKTPISEANVKQIEWWLHIRPNTKNGVLPVTTLFFWKFCFSLRTSYKELICCTNNPNAHIFTFCKSWSFIWRCFFNMSILKCFKKPYVSKKPFVNVLQNRYS